MSNISINFKSAPTIKKFMADDNPVRIVVGCIGSGKSVGVVCVEVMRRALMQEPSPLDNIRYFKALIVRNTMPELRKTTVKTWLSIFPENIGKFNSTVLTHHIKIPSTEGNPGLDLLVEFMGLDGPHDAAKLLSYEGTLIAFNEVKEINKEIVDMASGRVGRYPSKKHGGVMPSWYGIIMDTNPYTSGHWLDKLEKDTPSTWSFYRQPPGVLEMEKVDDNVWKSLEPKYPLTITNPEYIHQGGGCDWSINPKAENLPNLPVNKHLDPTMNPLKSGGYYAAMLGGKDKNFITIYLQGKNGALSSDQAVIPEFDISTMVSPEAMYNQGLTLQCGIDFGAGTLNPAAVFGQLDLVHNRWTVLKEVVCGGMGLMQFADQMLLTINEHFRDAEIQIWGDPAGLQRDGINMKTYFDHLRTKGLYALPAPSNKIEVRIECIRTPMLRYSEAKPAFLVHPKCNVLVEALAEKWCYNRLNVAGEVRFDDKPNKSHPYSDVADALGYMLSGGGEYTQLTAGKASQGFSQGFVMNNDFEVF